MPPYPPSAPARIMTNIRVIVPVSYTHLDVYKRQHPDHEAIVSFLRNYRVYPVCLQQGPLQDIGGILPLREEEKAEK